ncbi:AAA domain-containing protein [Sphingobium sp. AP50]|nr:AAA domain-containing protein [Sphingobium sp. AP50]
MTDFALQHNELDHAVMELFDNRCAFCETERPVLPYRFRPVEDAGPSSNVAAPDATRTHLYYTWLANAWENIYAICERCWPRDASVFPVRSTRCPLPNLGEIEAELEAAPGRWVDPIREDALLIDPCEPINFSSHFLPLPSGMLIPKGDRGATTIEHFRLNREDLVIPRQRQFEYRLDALARLHDRRHRTDIKGGLFDFDHMEFGGSWRCLLLQLGKMMSSSTLKLGREKELERFFVERMKAPRAREQLLAAIYSLNSDPDRYAKPRLKRWRAGAGRSWPKAIRIENFKSLECLEFALEEPAKDVADGRKRQGKVRAPLLMILGENATGKSSVLEAITLALADDHTLADRDLEPVSLMLDPEYLGGPPNAALQGARLSVDYEWDEHTSLEIGLHGFVTWSSHEHSRIPVFAYGAFRVFVAQPGRLRPPSGIRSLFEPDHILPDPEAWLVSIAHLPVFAEVVRALRAILALEQDFDLIRVAGGRCYLDTVVPGPNGPVTAPTPLSLVSSGFRSVLGMVCDVLRGLISVQDKRGASLANARAVVLIDEIETHLHPRWKMQIVKGLREALPGVVFIATTHDPLCLRGLSRDEVVVLRRSSRPLQLHPGPLVLIEKMLDLPSIDTMTVEQLLTSDFFQLFTTDAEQVETSFARVGDLLARTQADKSPIADAERAERLRQEIRQQIGRALPIGSTDVERLVQEAVEKYLQDRSVKPADQLPRLRSDTRDEIVRLLEQI